ncbi:MAG: hypothetical protein KDE55_01885 [Novosphingobium sp.]|nr:hypothetical protein [Novosphingobium sp.]
MTTRNTQTCNHCRHWQALVDIVDGTEIGLCRCLPPPYEGWPRTYPDDWCGEYAQKLAFG